jgi:hypothetical protein
MPIGEEEEANVFEPTQAGFPSQNRLLILKTCKTDPHLYELPMLRCFAQCLR